MTTKIVYEPLSEVTRESARSTLATLDTMLDDMKGRLIDEETALAFHVLDERLDSFLTNARFEHVQYEPDEPDEPAEPDEPPKEEMKPHNEAFLKLKTGRALVDMLCMHENLEDESMRETAFHAWGLLGEALEALERISPSGERGRLFECLRFQSKRVVAALEAAKKRSADDVDIDALGELFTHVRLLAGWLESCDEKLGALE